MTDDIDYCCEKKCFVEPDMQYDGIACKTCNSYNYCKCACSSWIYSKRLDNPNDWLHDSDSEDDFVEERRCDWTDDDTDTTISNTKYCCDRRCFKEPQWQYDGKACGLCNAYNYCICECKTFQEKEAQEALKELQSLITDLRTLESQIQSKPFPRMISRNIHVLYRTRMQQIQKALVCNSVREARRLRLMRDIEASKNTINRTSLDILNDMTRRTETQGFFETLSRRAARKENLQYFEDWRESTEEAPAFRYKTPSAETQGFVEDLFPSLKRATEGVANITDSIQDAVDRFHGWCKAIPEYSSTLNTVLFLANQLLMIKDQITPMTILHLIVSMFLYSGISLKETLSRAHSIIGICIEYLSPEPTSDSLDIRINTIAATYRDQAGDKAESQMGLEVLKPIVDQLTDNSSLVCGAVISLVTAVCALPFVPTNIMAMMTKMKKLGDGANSATSWIKSLLSLMQDQYYKQIYGCTRAEHQLSELIPEFYNLMQDTYTLLSIPMEKFMGSKRLCEIVKRMYSEYQNINSKIVLHKSIKELSYAFHSLERKFLPLYESVKSSPLFNNISRARPTSVYFYGKPGVGKSNLVAMMAAMCAKRLYPNRQFNGENSVMWNRRIENEFHDGYAHQPFVYFDDCLQAVDTTAKPNPEFREVIYMINDAPYQLHMSDIKEKKNTYFDSEHVIASSNISVPVAHSIVDIGAFTRRFDFAIEVKVRPQYGKLHKIKRRSKTDTSQDDTYYMVDEAKAKTALNTDIYELHHYQLSTGNPVVENGVAKVQTFDQFIDEYCAHYATRKQKQIDQRAAIYSQLNVTIEEDDTIQFKGAYAETHMGLLDGLLKKKNNDEQVDMDDIFALLDAAEPPVLHQEKPTIKPFFDGDDIKPYHLDKDPSPEIMDEVHRLDTIPIDERDYNDENDITLFDEPEAKSGLADEVRMRYVAMREKAPRLFSHCVDKLANFYNSTRELLANSKKPLFIGVGLLCAGLVAYYFLKPKVCKLKLATEPSTSIFAEVCKNKCEDCDYLKATLGGSILFGTGNESRIQLGTWNLRAAEILTRKDKKWAASTDYWANFLRDVTVTLDMEEETSQPQMGRRRKRAFKAAQAEMYGRNHTQIAKAEAYGRLAQCVARPEQYGRSVEKVAEIQAGSCFDFNSIAAASEQYVRILLRNNVTILVDGMRTSGLFLTGRSMLCNHHVWVRAERHGSFEIRNPGQTETTTIKFSECRSDRVNRGGDYDQDLVVVELPQHIPMRPDIMSKIVDAPRQFAITDASATLVGFNKIGGHETLSERPIETVEVVDVPVADGDYTHQIRRGYGYSVLTRKGDCGSLLFTHSTLSDGKLIGFHSAGIPKIGQGYSEALERKSLQRSLDRLKVKTCLPVVGETQGLTRLERWHDLGDVIHHGDSEFAPHQATKHEHKPSILSGVLAEPKAKLAHLKPVVKDGEIIDPLKRGLAKVANTPARLNETLLNCAVNDVKRTVKNTMDAPFHGVISYVEAITGVENDPYIGPVKRSTAPGEPWKSQKKTTYPGKKEWLNKVIDGELTDEYRTDEPTLRKAVFDRIENAKQGKRTPALYTASLKDERRPKEKVDAVKTRVFAAAPQDYVLAVRMYFADFVASMMDNRIKNEVAVGIDHRTEWPTLVSYLQGYGNNNIAGDFSNFDGSLLSEVLWKICDVINGWYNDGEENCLIREILFEDIANAYVNCQGHVIQWTHSQPSGNPLTVIVNSMFQMIMFRYVYLLLKVEEGLPLSCDFRRNVRMVTYGDDGLLSVKSHIAPWFNQTAITAAFATVGLTYTDEAKTGVLHTTRPLTDLTFLKRAFKQTDGIWMGALEKDVIYEMCLWTRHKFETIQTQENCQEALKEAVAHGEEFYNQFAGELDAANDRTGRRLDLHILSYDEMLEEMFTDYY